MSEADAAETRPWRLEVSKEELLREDYTHVLRTEDPDLREAATKHLGIRRVPILTGWVLKPHQLEVLQWLHERESTPSSTCAAASSPSRWVSARPSQHPSTHSRGSAGSNPTLIVCSKTLMASWKTDLEKFLGPEWVATNVIFLHREHLGARGLDDGITRQS